MRQFKSIRFTIVFWYTLILTVVLSAFSSLVYVNLRKDLRDTTDDILQLKAEGVSGSINTYWEMEKEDGLRLGARAEAFDKIDNLNFLKIAQRWVKEQSNDPKLSGIIVVVIDHRGNIIASSWDSPGRIHFSRQSLVRVMAGQSVFDNTVMTVPAGKRENLRTFTQPVVENGRVAYMVQVSNSLEAMEVTLQKLRFIFLVALPLAVLCSIVAGFLLARLILGPLKRIIGQMRGVTAENLQRRIKTPDTHDEIRELVDNFNLMLDKLETSFTTQRQLVQDISHELRTPLTILKGEMGLALKRRRPVEEYLETIESGLEEIDRISRIIENLLVVSRFDSREVQLDLGQVQLDVLLQGISDDLRLLAERKHLTTTFDLSPLSVRGDVLQLRRAFLNLIDNAIKYTPDGGAISVTAAPSGESASVTITDTGIGIPAEHLPFIFNRFYRVDQSRSGEGFGLGLCIVKSIITAHNGSIDVRSSLGSGTTFTVTLPH
jgi:heavy metal sensor kinase